MYASMYVSMYALMYASMYPSVMYWFPNVDTRAINCGKPSVAIDLSDRLR